MSALSPVPPRERVVTLDVLRGLALCGVMIGNMVLYSGRWAARGGGPRTTLDEIAQWIIVILVESKAQTLLTLLFGFGFAVQLLRADERREPVMGLYARRLAVLFVLGSLHVSLLWWGDVTWTYAIAGVGLLGFLRGSNRTRVIAALVLVFVPRLLVSIPEIRNAAVGLVIDPHVFRPRTAHMLAALHSPDHGGLAGEHVRYALTWVAFIYPWYFFWTLGRFLLGYVAGKLRWFDGGGAHRLPMFRALAIRCGAVAAVTTAFGVLEELQVISLWDHRPWGPLVSQAIGELGLLSMALTYVGVVVLLMQRPAWRRVLGVLAPLGRMPLTTYFSQSLICTFIFYGWGLGRAGLIGIAGCLGLALAIFCVQIAICQLWLGAFRLGPLEWVWRSAVYQKLQPMRLASATVPP